MPPYFLLSTLTVLPHSCFLCVASLFIGCGVCVIHILICQSVLPFIRENIVNLGSTPCTVFYKDILHSFYPKSIYFNVWVSAPGNRSIPWWCASCSRSVSLPVRCVPAGGPAAAPQPSSSASSESRCCCSQLLGGCVTAVMGEEDSSAIPPHGSLSYLNRTSQKGLFELTGCWTHIPFQKWIQEQMMWNQTGSTSMRNEWDTAGWKRVKSGRLDKQRKGKNTVRKSSTCCISEASTDRPSFSLTITLYSTFQLLTQWISHSQLVPSQKTRYTELEIICLSHLLP